MILVDYFFPQVLPLKATNLTLEISQPSVAVLTYTLNKINIHRTYYGSFPFQSVY